MYNDSIDPSLFNFVKSFTITELGFSDKNNIQIPIILNINNFDFSRIRNDGGDIRFTERESGQYGLFYWISDFDYVNKNVIIWLEIPKLMKNEVKTIYMFFGNSDLSTTSNLNNLNFTFKYYFDHTPISSAVFAGSLTTGVNEYGYYLGNSNIKFSIITNPLRGLNKWEFFINLYYSESIKNISLDFLGEENDIYFRFNGENSITHNVRTGSNQSYTELQSGCESDSFNLLYFAYDEPIDMFFYRASARNTFIDYKMFMERSVEGNTDINTIRFNGNYDSNARLKYVLTRKYIRDEVDVDLSSLYPESSDYYNSVFVDTEQYSDNLVESYYYHGSDIGGYPKNLSNGLYDDYNTFWASIDEVNSGYLIIDFGTDGNNLVDTSYRHISSGNTGSYTSHKLSSYVTSEHDYWLGRQTYGISCIDFDDDPKQVNCLVLQGYDETGMVKRFRFKGSYRSPINSSTSNWQVLYEGECERTDEKQYFYFRNFSTYRYYMVEVLSTYGSNIKLKNWYMYKMSDLDVFSGVTVDRVSLRPSLYESNQYNFPRIIGVEASNDHRNWTTLLEDRYTYSPFSESLYGCWQHFVFKNSNKYRVYKILLEETWGANERFIIDGLQLSQSLSEKRTHRVLQTTNNDILKVYTNEDTGFDSGWVYGLNRDDFFYIKDNYLARKESLAKGFDLTSLFLSITK